MDKNSQYSEKIQKLILRLYNFQNGSSSTFVNNAINNMTFAAAHPEMLTDEQRVAIDVAVRDLEQNALFPLQRQEIPAPLRRAAAIINIDAWHAMVAMARDECKQEISGLSQESQTAIAAYIAQYHSYILQK